MRRSVVAVGVSLVLMQPAGQRPPGGGRVLVPVAGRTKPEIVKRWLLAPEGWSLADCQIDLRVGGAFRYVWRNGADGEEFVVSGVYTDITRPARVVHTEQFDDPVCPGESLETWTFEERDGATTFTTTLSYDSVEAYEGSRVRAGAR